MKWGLVLAGAADFARPADKLSLTQNFALMCTGAIWTRWCLIIKPKNVLYVMYSLHLWKGKRRKCRSYANRKVNSLATVNAFLFCVGATQVTRIFMYNQSIKRTSPVEEIKEAAKEQAAVVEGVAKDPKGAAKAAQKA